MRAALTMPAWRMAGRTHAALEHVRLAGRAIAQAVARHLAHLPDDTSAVLLHHLLLHHVALRGAALRAPGRQAIK